MMSKPEYAMVGGIYMIFMLLIVMSSQINNANKEVRELRAAIECQHPE